MLWKKTLRQKSQASSPSSGTSSGSTRSRSSLCTTPAKAQEAQGKEVKDFEAHPTFTPGETRTSTFAERVDRKSTRLNSSHGYISYAVFCLKKKKNKKRIESI